MGAAAPATSHERAPTSGPTRKDRVIANLLRFVVRLLYRDVEVHWAAPDGGHGAPRREPRVIVANHFGGVADALVLLAVLPTRPGVVASGVIWKVPLVGRLLDWVGAIPVHKVDDGGGGSSNDAMFASCYAALARGTDVLIFPEGVTRNEPSIAEVRTGAARIALGARANGADHATIVPVGIHYENKARLRSRVFVNGGEVLDPATAVPDADPSLGADDRAAVVELTAAIDRGLRGVAPDYADWSEAHLLTAGAEIALREQLADPADAVPIGLRDRLANALAARPEPSRRRMCDAVAAYRRDLDDLGVSDAQLASRIDRRRFVRFLFDQLVLGVLLAPFALVGAVVNLLPYVTVKLVGRRRMAASMHATVKPLVAIAAAALTWGFVVWRSVVTWGWQGGAVAVVLLPVYTAAAIVFVERLVSLWQLVARQRRGRRAPHQLRARLASERSAVVEEVLTA